MHTCSAVMALAATALALVAVTGGGGSHTELYVLTARHVWPLGQQFWMASPVGMMELEPSQHTASGRWQQPTLESEYCMAQHVLLPPHPVVTGSAGPGEGGGVHMRAAPSGGGEEERPSTTRPAKATSILARLTEFLAFLGLGLG